MKRAIGVGVAGIVLVVLVLAAVVVGRALVLKPEVTTVAAAVSVPIDEAGAVVRFAGAIRVKTESQYLVPPDQPSMKAFRDYLETNFPKVHATMKREVTPEGALIFTWTGKDTTAAPVVMMGHMDVVPVPAEALPKWKHGPYSGDIADGFIWGRGTLDDKIHVLSLMEAAETLIGRGFVPARTILFCFGDDEESGGVYGAKKIVALLQSRGVKPVFVVDEGGAVIQGMVPGVKEPLALVGIAEKGFVDLELTTSSPGGHSSEPPKHTAIGQLAAALEKLEAKPFPTHLTPATEEQYEALAPYMPFDKKVALSNLWLFKPLIISGGMKDPVQAGTYHTTTAETMISGGFKDNALPPSAKAVINFRILPGETVDTVADRVRKVIDDPGVTVTVATNAGARNPSPISPLDSDGFKTLKTTIQQDFPGAVVSPYQINAATDSGYYTVLTPNVYRFLAVEADPSTLTMIHGLNERIAPEKYVKTVEFTAQFLQNIR